MGSFDELCLRACQSLNVEELEVFVMVAWAEWWSRNCEVFEAKWKTPNEILEAVGRIHGDYHNCAKIEHSSLVGFLTGLLGGNLRRQGS